MGLAGQTGRGCASVALRERRVKETGKLIGIRDVSLGAHVVAEASTGLAGLGYSGGLGWACHGGKGASDRPG